RWWEGGDIYGDLPPVNGGLVLPFIYPPFAAVTAIPFAVLPWTLSYTLLYVLGIACIVGTVYLVGRHLYPQASRRMTMAAAGASLVVLLCLEPLRETFAFGQINLLLMGLVAIDCLARRTRWPRGIGVCLAAAGAWLEVVLGLGQLRETFAVGQINLVLLGLVAIDCLARRTRWPRVIGVGLAAAIKLTPAVFALYFRLRRDYRAFWVSAATGAAATALGFVVNPSGSVTSWFGGLAGAADVSGSTYRTNQAVQSVLARLGMDGAALPVVTVVVVLILLALVVVGVRTNTPETGLMLCAALSLLAS